MHCFRRMSLSVMLVAVFAASARAAQVPAPAGSAPADEQRALATYVAAVTQGAGLMPWQKSGPSPAEQTFRDQIEHRKDELLASRSEVRHPVLLTDAQIEQARRNIDTADWARHWYKQQLEIAKYVAAQDDGYVERMIPELTPTNTYGFTCPNCVGRKSQEGVGLSIFQWDHRRPDVCSCGACGHEYPSQRYPETARLVCPRSGQTFTYYLTEQEREHPDDRSGRYAYHWVSRPIHVSFTGAIRHAKIGFMIGAARSLALAYRMTDDQRYARRAIQILVRLAHCYRQWLYHDYWDTVADCDPIYAAWHDKALPMEWKRHLCSGAYKNDQPDQAAMLQNYWGAGRIHPSTDGIGHLGVIARAYDLVHDAHGRDGQPLWSDAARRRVERDLILEYLMGAEPFVGGAGAATAVNNKTPGVYHAMAVVARCLGLAAMADTALRGYEAVRDQSFLYDGFSKESPAYTNMYLASLVQIPEVLHGFQWPAGFPSRQGSVDLYASDERLRLMFRALIDQLCPDGRYPPLSDTTDGSVPAAHLLELGLRRFPEYYDGRMPALSNGEGRTEYAIFNLSPEQLARDAGELNLPEILFPAWMTAMLRHGSGPQASMLTLTFSPSGAHRHADNLSVFYIDRGRTILGDQGYVGDMPLNNWIHSTVSHNLVIVDDAEQRHRQTGRERRPRLRRMFTSPRLSLTEAASDVYDQCRQYRRLVALIKGPGAQTFAVDVFRVSGGDRHDYRIFSELASSDAPEGRITFRGLTMPAEPPLPQVGASLDKADIFGLRDVRSVASPPPEWEATWEQPDRRYRLWMLTPADRVEASNGPGQETREQAGRRVRYLDVLREGKNFESTFVAVHEPSGPDGRMPIERVERLPLPASAGSDAVALRIMSAWGTYLIFSDCETPAETDGVRFQGAFGALYRSPGDPRWLITSGARTLTTGGIGFENDTPSWSGRILEQNAQTLTADSAAPDDGMAQAGGVTPYVLVEMNEGLVTGLPVRQVRGSRIQVDRFPPPPSSSFRLDRVRFIEEPGS